MEPKVFLLLLLFGVLLDQTVPTENGQHDPVTICDNGKYLIEEDIGDENGQCSGSPIVITEYFEPSGHTHCESNTQKGEVTCMRDILHYLAIPPSSGSYRLLAPKYGEYRYIPPQRWLHALKFGAVVFLYHPCAPLDQVMALKEVAKNCLRKHIITPYSHLSEKKPLALVTWGCVYNMTWVDKSSVKQWIKAHALKTPESVVSQDGQYDHDLLHSAETVSDKDDSVLCPLDATVTIEPPDLSTSSDSKNTTDPLDTMATIEPPNLNNSQPTSDHTQLVTPTNCSRQPHVCQQVTVIIFVQHHPFVIALFAISLTLFLIMVAVWVCCWKRGYCTREKRPNGRYKPVNQFFPNKDRVVGIAIPEMGLPKTLPSEREKLLIESDEDEL